MQDGDSFEYYRCERCGDQIIAQFKSDHSANCKKSQEEKRSREDSDDVEVPCDKCGILIKGITKYFEHVHQAHSNSSQEEESKDEQRQQTNLDQLAERNSRISQHRIQNNQQREEESKEI